MNSCKLAVLTIFPQMIQEILSSGVLKRAEVQCIDLRAFAPNGRVDAPVFGHGKGMLFRADVLAKAVETYKKDNPKAYVVHLSPRGTLLDARKARGLAQKGCLLLIASRYEGADQRFLDRYVDEEVSIGDYVLSGGELAAAVLADTILRCTEEVLSSEASLEESFEQGLLEYPHYAPPQEFQGEAVPKVLRSGSHVLIAQWRLRQSLAETFRRRIDLLCCYPLLPFLEHKNPLTQIKKQNALLRQRTAQLEQAIQEIKDVRKRKY